MSTMRKRHIRFERTTPTVKSRLTWGQFYAAESVVAPSVMYVLDEDVIAVVTEKQTVMLSPDIAEEIGIMLEYINDSDNRRMLRRMRAKREGE